MKLESIQCMGDNMDKKINDFVILHTQGDKWIINDIDEFIKIRQAKSG